MTSSLGTKLVCGECLVLVYNLPEEAFRASQQRLWVSQSRPENKDLICVQSLQDGDMWTTLPVSMHENTEAEGEGMPGLCR